MNVSIIIPVYHEEENIEQVIKKISQNVKIQHEIIVVYDTKDDPTYNVIKKISGKNKNVKAILNNSGNGQGVINAIKTGLKSAQGKGIVITMADLSDDISQIDTMFLHIKNGYDIVAASRYMPGGEKIGGPFFKTFLSKFAGVTLYYIFKIPTHDATNAFKMYNRDIFKKIKIESTGGFEYSLEITLKAFRKGYKIIEIPTVWHDRETGKSNFKLLLWLPKYLKTYFLILKNND